MIQIDGNHLEGGGQIIRTALALSALTGKEFSANNIRAGRKKPGLKAQHLHCIHALQKLCSAKIDSCELGVESLTFKPGKIKVPITITEDIGTAGAMTLLLQSILLPSILSGGKVKLKLTGGTDVNWSMPYDYFNQLVLPHLKKYADIECKLINRGYFPKGNGEIELKIKGKYEFDLEKLKEAPQLICEAQGIIMQIKGISHASQELSNAQVAERQARAAHSFLSKKYHCPITIRSEYRKTLSPGSGITLWAVFSKCDDDVDVINPIRLGGSALGKKGIRAEEVGENAAKEIDKNIKSGSSVDSYLADNLIPFLGVFGGKINCSEITNHTRSNIYVCEKFLDVKFEIDEEKRIIEVKKEIMKIE
ncbi:RNA 3'-terminal phosphate cyclase [Candidatus Woesearchaeota archaeon]|jgi:RNA 3'-terminal phosphate cyclase (GTP)|nr:RNA 3'-terminal phosphate cyclase [Candidatus Woesearchaeota archaeon]